MAGPRIRGKTPSRSGKQGFTESVELPRWVVGVVVLIVGLILWLGADSDVTGKLRLPGPGSILCLAAVIGLAAFLICGRPNKC